MPSKAIGAIITEDIHTPAEVKVVGETSDRVVAEACLQEAEEENRNGRCYLTEDLKREQECKRTVELLRAGYMLGEAGHPTDTSIIRQQTIAPDNTAVRYLKYWMDGPRWMAHYQGTYNSLGEAVDMDLRHGYLPAFSMRSLGCLESVNGRNIVRDLRYITHDFVIYPSHPGAYTHGLVQESGGVIKPDPSRKSRFEKLFTERAGLYTRKGKVTPIYNEQVISYIKAESANVKGIIEQFELLYESISVTPDGRFVDLKSKNGDTFHIVLEHYVQNELYDYCTERAAKLENHRIRKEIADL